jgi:hypothetical protein
MRNNLLTFSVFLLMFLVALWLGTKPPSVVYKGTWCCASGTALTATGEAAGAIIGNGCTEVGSTRRCKGEQPVKISCTGNSIEDHGAVTCPSG